MMQMSDIDEKFKYQHTRSKINGLKGNHFDVETEGG